MREEEQNLSGEQVKISPRFLTFGSIRHDSMENQSLFLLAKLPRKTVTDRYFNVKYVIPYFC